jgi:multiple sugar transport system substrate-binding protein
MSTRSFIGIIVLGAVAAVSFFAAPAFAQQKLSFLAAEYSAKTLPFWEEVVADFEAANPDIDVTLEVVDWNTIHDRTAQRIAAGTLPDLVNTATIWVPEWVDAGAIRPIGDDIVDPALKADFVPALFEKGAVYEGENWGLPIAAAARAILLNKGLLEQAGIDASAPIATWDDYKTIITTVKEKTGAFGYAFDAKGVRAFRDFGYYLLNNGGKFFNDDGTAAFNSSEGVEALQFLVDIVKAGAVPDPLGTTLEDYQPMYEAGRVATMINGNFAIAGIKANAPSIEIAVAPVPVKTAGQTPVTWGVTDTLVISKTAPVEPSRKFIAHIFSTAVRNQFDEAEGMLPVLKSQADNPAFTGDPNIVAFINMLPTSQFDPFHPQYAQMQELVKTAMQSAITGAASPKDALDKAATDFNALVKG